MCILSVHTLLKVVGYYDLSVLSMSVMGFQKKTLDGGWVSGLSSIQVFFGFLEFFNFAKPPNLIGELVQVRSGQLHLPMSQCEVRTFVEYARELCQICTIDNEHCF